MQWFFDLTEGADSFKVSAKLLIERSKDTCEGTRQFLEGMTHSMELLTVRPALAQLEDGIGGGTLYAYCVLSGFEQET